MKLVESILKKAEHPAYAWIVFILTVCESIFLFVPPEVFMTPPIIANRRRAIPITVAAAAGSLVGGAIAYLIGYWLFGAFPEIYGMLIGHVADMSNVEKYS